MCAAGPIRPVFADNPVATPDRYTEVVVDAARVLQDWRRSLFAHELVDSHGFVKGDDDLSETRLEKRMQVRARLAQGEALEKPILGVGMFDNVEIGAGSDVLATLVMEGVTIIPVHVRQAHRDELKAFCV